MIASHVITPCELMKIFNSYQFLAAFGYLRELEGVGAMSQPDPLDSSSQLIIDNVITPLSLIEDSFDELGLPVAKYKAQAVRGRVQANTLTSATLSSEIRGLSEILSYEMQSHVFMYIEPTKAYLYTGSELFGHEVATSFPSSSFDIEEAGKCLALNRSTACVFHLMRVLETGLYAVANALGVQDIELNWHNAIEQTEKKIRALPAKTPQEKIDLGFYSDASAYLFGVKEPWRNRSAHTGNIYIEEKSQQIFESVRGFMQVLSTRLTE